MRCDYCYNKDIVFSKKGQYNYNDVLSFLETRKNLLDSVVLSGGEASSHELVLFCQKIKEMGFVQSHRRGSTGIGKTLEDLLGITENNIAGPDFSVFELKAGRKNSTSMLTLFTKAPMPNGVNKKLLEVLVIYNEKGQ